jgi:ATP-dependent 26S proteasome regulatory subunit
MNNIGTGNLGDLLKQMLLPMYMMNSMNGTQQNGKSNIMNMIYILLVTFFIDNINRYSPLILKYIEKQYTKKIENITNIIVSNDASKNEKCSIIIPVIVNETENMIGLSLLDYITNSKEIKHVSFKNQLFVINQKDELYLGEDIYCILLDSTDIPKNNDSRDDTTKICQTIQLYSYKKSTQELRNFLNDVTDKFIILNKNKLGNRRFYFNMHPIQAPHTLSPSISQTDKTKTTKDYSKLPPNFIFTMKHFQTNRKFSNLFGEDIDIIRTRVEFFVNNRSWYNEKGVPYTLGLLLSGPPGTGKTSSIKCLANETGRHVININFNNDMSKTQLENLFFNDTLIILNSATGQNERYSIPLDQRIYVLEDIDCQSDIVKERSLLENSSNKENQTEDTNKVDLSFLLNLLDGIFETPGRIVIMTSNHPKILDKALIRPGRIDVIADFQKCSNETILKMIEFFYDRKLEDEFINRINKLIPRIITPAEMSKIMFENFSDYVNTIIQLENLSGEKVLKPVVENLEKIEDKQLENTSNNIKEYTVNSLDVLLSPLSNKIPNCVIPKYDIRKYTGRGNGEILEQMPKSDDTYISQQKEIYSLY